MNISGLKNILQSGKIDQLRDGIEFHRLGLQVFKHAAVKVRIGQSAIPVVIVLFAGSQPYSKPQGQDDNFRVSFYVITAHISSQLKDFVKPVFLNYNKWFIEHSIAIKRDRKSVV